VSLLATKDGETEASNGLINRHFISWQVGDKIVPDPKPGSQLYWDQMADAYRNALLLGWGGFRYRVSAEDTVEITFTAEAKELLRDWYVQDRSVVDASRVQGLMVRKGDFLRGYAAALALLRGTTEIDVPDLQAGIALLDYWRASIEFLFSQGAQTATAEAMARDARKLLEKMVIGKPATMYELRHTPTKRRHVLIDWMQRQSPPWVSMSHVKGVAGNRSRTELIRLR
jgi:hypothetical protein